MSFQNLHAKLDGVLAGVAPQLDASNVDELIAIRVSDDSRKKLAGHFAEGLRIYDQHFMVGPWMRQLPPNLFTDATDAERHAYGIQRLELGHVFDGSGSSKRIGYVAIAGNAGRLAVMLFVHHTACAADFETSAGPLNTWAELTVGTWLWARQSRIMRFSRDDRMSRSLAVWVRINDAVKARPGAKYCLGGLEVNPHLDSWQGMILGQKASDEVEMGKIRRLSGKLTKMTDGAWAQGHVPVGLRLGRVEDVRGELQPDKSVGVEVDPQQVKPLTRLLEGYAEGLSKALLAVREARGGARDGRGALLLPHIVPLLGTAERQAVRDSLPAMLLDGTISPAEEGRVAAALAEDSNPCLREAATGVGVNYVDRILRARKHLRTGVLNVVTFGDIAGRTEYNGWRPTFVTDETQDWGDAQAVSMSGLEPGHPFWSLSESGRSKARTHGMWVIPFHTGPVVSLPDRVWSEIDRREEQAVGDFRRRAIEGERRPLGGLRWPGAEGHFRIGQGGESETYRITGPDGQHLHTINAAHAAQSLGRLFMDLVERVDVRPLPLLPPPADTVESRARRLQERVDHQVEQVLEIEAQIVGLHRALATVSPESRQFRLISGQLEQLDRAADEIEQQVLPSLRARLSDLEHEDDGELEETGADFAQLAVVGAALLTGGAKGPAALHEAIWWLLDGGSGLENLRSGENGRQLLIDVKVRVPLADGTVGLLDAGTLDLTDRRVSPSRKREAVDDLARRLLRDGEPMDALTQRYGWTPDQVLVHAAEWLAKNTNLNMYLRAAVVTAAAAGGQLPVGPVVFAHASGDDSPLDRYRSSDDSWIVDSVLRAYTGPGATWAKNSGWVRGPLAASRDAMALISAEGPLRRETLISSIDDIRNDEHLKDLLHPGRRSFWQPPLLLRDGWIEAHRCHLASCPGGGDAPMTGVLPVPELIITGDAVYCEFCWSSLTTQRPLPPEYRHRYDTASATSSLQRADGIPHLAEAPSVPVRAVKVLRTRDVAADLGLPIHQVQRLVTSGQIPATRKSTGKLVFDAERALAPAIRNQWGRGLPQTQSGDPRRLTLTQTAERLGATRGVVRVLARAGLLTNTGAKDGALYDLGDVDRILVDIRRQTGRAHSTFAELMTLAELADTCRMTTTTIRRLLAHGVLSEIAIGSLAFVDRLSVERLTPRERRALDPDERLSAAQVGERAGLHASTVIHHFHRDALQGVQFTPNGTVHFLPNEVDAWLRSRQDSTNTRGRRL